MDIKFVEYDKEFLHLSAKWLSDPEIRELTQAPKIIASEQMLWYSSLKYREDYFIEGIIIDNVPVGACGIKKIDFIKSMGEYWGYIGEKKYIGKGNGKYIVEHVCDIAKVKGIHRLVLHVVRNNIRAYNLYLKQGFIQMLEIENLIYMEKIII